jgi:long-chain acyl-CoA synthetase
VLTAGHEADTDALLEYCRERLAAYKVPRAVHYVQALPTTSTGKLMRGKPRESHADST